MGRGASDRGCADVGVSARQGTPAAVRSQGDDRFSLVMHNTPNEISSNLLASSNCHRPPAPMSCVDIHGSRYGITSGSHFFNASATAWLVLPDQLIKTGVFIAKPSIGPAEEPLLQILLLAASCRNVNSPRGAQHSARMSLLGRKRASDRAGRRRRGWLTCGELVKAALDVIAFFNRPSHHGIPSLSIHYQEAHDT